MVLAPIYYWTPCVDYITYYYRWGHTNSIGQYPHFLNLNLPTKSTNSNLSYHNYILSLIPTQAPTTLIDGTRQPLRWKSSLLARR